MAYNDFMIEKVLLKSPADIQGIQRACQATNRILDRVADLIGPGITTDQINTWVEQATAEAGGRAAPLGYKGFPKSTCTSINDVICHGIPDTTELREGDIVNVDVTTILDGFYGDVSRMFLIGEVNPEARRLSEVTRECLEKAIEVVRPGNTLGDIGHAIQKHAESHRFSVVRDFTGHGIGRRFHEAPTVLHYGRPGTGLRLKPGMVFTIEPMINAGQAGCRILSDGWTAVTRDGSLSAQWEHTVAVTRKGCQVLSANA